MSTKQAYKTKIQLAFIGSKYVEINPNMVKYILIEHMYENKAMPIIYMSISLNIELYKMIFNEKDSAKLFLRIQRVNVYSGTSLSKDYIKDQFMYILPSLITQDELKINNSNVDSSSYKTLTIGLINEVISDSMRKTFGGILKDIDQHSLIYKAIEGTKIIIKDPIYNKKYNNIYIPPMSSRKQMINFIFSKDPFYNTDYIYFMDFNTSYLLDKSGEAVNVNNNKFNNIIIDVKPINEIGIAGGLEERDNYYYLSINPENINMNLDIGSEKISNQLVSVDDESTVVDINRSNNSKVKQSFKRIGKSSAIIYKNAVESSQICFEIIKENIDSRYITPNKTIMINYKGFDNYSGMYILLYKKEIICGSANDFVSTVTLGVKKVSDIKKIE